jgi:hypothetical protein
MLIPDFIKRIGTRDTSIEADPTMSKLGHAPRLPAGSATYFDEYCDENLVGFTVRSALMKILGPSLELELDP